MGRLISQRYEELAQLGQGGQGLVFKVRDLEQGTICALKALPTYLLENEEAVARFEREITVLQRLQHQNIIRVFASGRDEALQWRYFVMEYIEGQALKQYLKEHGALPLAEVIDVTAQAARALVYAHRQTPPVIHRDMKPANIMIEEPSRRVVVLDFGIAKQLDTPEQFRTKTGAMVGTLKYCAPEQLRQMNITGSVDVYSLGLIMYEMLTGTQFFSSRDEYTVMARVLDLSQENAPTFPPTVPAALAAIIRKAIAKSPDTRYAKMIDFLAELEAFRRALNESQTVLVHSPDAAMPAVEPPQQPTVVAPRPVRIAEAPPAPAPLQPKKDEGSPRRLLDRIAAVLPARRERTPVPSAPPLQKDAPVQNPPRLFTADGTVNRALFDAEAIHALATATADSQCLGDTRIAPFHLLISLTRGPYLKELASSLMTQTGTNTEVRLKMLRARVRHAYHRPIVEARMIVRELYQSDLELETQNLLHAAARRAQPERIGETHLLAALLEQSPADLLPVLYEHGLTLENLRQYKRETP